MAFVTEQVPQSFIDSFDATRLRGEFGLGSIPTNPLFRWGRWTIDKERDVALILVDHNSMTRRTGDDTLPPRRWYALIWKGSVISFEATMGGYATEEIDLKTGRNHEFEVWENTDIWLDDDLINQLSDILELTKEAYYVALDGPELPWIKGVEINIRSINDKAVGGTS